MTRPISRREFAKRASSLAVVPAAMTLAHAPAVGGRPGGRGDGATRPHAAPLWNGYADAMVIDCLGSPGPFSGPDRMGSPLTPEMLENST